MNAEQPSGGPKPNCSGYRGRSPDREGLGNRTGSLIPGEDLVILVRFVCYARSGKAGELVEGFKRSAEVARVIVGPTARGRIFTDLSGRFDTVIQELEVESLAAWEQLRMTLFSDPRFQAAEAAMPDVIESGRTEFYTIQATWP
jgi:hypothetical protein